MNKIAKYGFIALSLALSLSACTDEADYTPASAVSEDCAEVSFSAEEDGFFDEVAPADEKVLTLTLTRDNTDGELTVPLRVARNDGNVFQVPESVTFADGERTKTFNVTFSDAEIGEVYTLGISLDESLIDPYKETTTAYLQGSVQVVQWNTLGVGTLTCKFLGGTAQCYVQKASHADWYRAVAPIEDGMNLVFKVNSDNSVTVEDQALFTDVNYGTVYVNNTSGGGIYYPDQHIIQAALYYYCSAGYFGTFVETLTLPTE